MPAVTRVLDPAQRQRVTGLGAETALQQHRQAPAFRRIVEVGLQRIDVGRQGAFLPQIVERVLVARNDELVGEPEAQRQRFDEARRGRQALPLVGIFTGEQGRIAPHRNAVGAPEARQRPARQRLARIPFPLAVVQCGAGCEARLQPPQQVAGEAALRRTAGRGVPFLAVHVVDRNEGRLAAHGQPYVVLAQLGVHRLAERVDLLPLGLGVRAGDARVLVDAAHLVGKGEVDLGGIGGAGDRRGTERIGRAGERDMALAGEQPRGRVETQPARTGSVDLRPGVQVGEVRRRPRGPVERFDVGRQLHQVSGDEARRQSEVAQDLHQQPAGVAARSERPRERLLARLDARLHAHGVGDVPLQAAIDVEQKRYGLLLAAVDGGHPIEQARAAFPDLEVRRQVARQLLVVAEREVLGVGLEKEVERVDHRHVGDQSDRDGQLAGALREHQARQVVAEGILLPVQKVLARLDLQRVGVDRRAAMRRRPQADDVREQRHRAVVAVARAMGQGDADGHGITARRAAVSSQSS